MNAYSSSCDSTLPSRILMTADASEGVWTYAMELARGLRPCGVEILLAVMGPAISREQREEAARLEHVSLCAKPFALEGMKDPWRDVTQAGDWLLELEEQFEPHVVHLNHYCHGSLPWSAPVLISAHGCVLSWWQAVHGEQSPRSWTRYHAEVAAGLRGANLVVAPTRAMFDSLTRLYAPIPQLLQFQNTSRFPGFRTIPHGRDAEGFCPLDKQDYVLSLSSPGDETQNFDMLNAVAERLPWPVVVGGRGPVAEGRSGGFAHLGCLDSLTSAERKWQMGRAAIFASPTRYDPFGFTVLEAALCGCALVLGDVPSLRETWGDAALFAPPDDAQAFGAALGILIEDAGLRTEMADRARLCALTFTPERMASEIMDCYRGLASHQSAPMEVDVG